MSAALVARQQAAFDRAQLVQIVEQSAFLQERLDGVFRPAPAIPAGEDVLRRAEEWRKTAAGGNPQRFERRLLWDGALPENAAALVGPVRLAASGLPDWTETLDRYARSIASRQPDNMPAWINSEESYAFEDLLAPLLTVAAERVSQQADVTLLSRHAFGKLQRALLKQLSMMAGKCLYLEFSSFRSQRQFGAGVFGYWPGAPSREAYQAFVNHMFEERLLDFLCEYPVLARFLAVATDQWVEATTEFLNRLARDLPDIESAFLDGRPPGEVIDVATGLSDRHNGGRSVILVRFAAGFEIVYKTKPLRAEQHYYELLKFLNANGAPFRLPVFRVLDRGTYGWSEKVEHRPCRDSSEVGRYFERAGMLLCLIYALEGTDCHYENIIASGEYPVLVDMECLLQHRVAEIKPDQGPWAAASRAFYMDSVFRTGLLPRWYFGMEGESFDLSGLAGIDVQLTGILTNTWQYVNTDSMRLLPEKKQTTFQKNVVQLHGQPVVPGAHVESIVRGFQATYDFLLGIADRLFAAGGPIERMRAMPVRFLYRNTRVYWVILQGLFSPRYLRNGADAGIRIDILRRPVLFSEDLNPFWRVVREEIRALQQGDIPVFHVSVDSTDLTAGPELIAGAFSRPSHEWLRENFNRLSGADRDRQISYIRSSFYTRSLGAALPRTVSSPEKPDQLSENDRRCLFIEEALRIARGIRDTAITSSDGSVTWITVAYFPEAERYQLQPMSPFLYEGTGGVAIFLAAVGQITGKDEFRDLAGRALSGIQADYSDSDFEQVLLERGIGAGIGGASTLYALVCCSRILGDHTLLVPARRIAAMLREERIRTDRKLDLMAGAAGGLVALLSYYSATGEREALNAATACGERLLAARTTSASGYRAWQTFEGKMLSGFSHGAAGISYALARLFQTTGDRRYREAAYEGYAYENSLFDPDSGNWWDIRFASPGSDRGQCSWCHGAPGIALARTLSVNCLAQQRPETHLEHALATTLREPLLDLDQLCCGNLGRADILLEAGRVLGRPEYVEQAAQLTLSVAARGRRTGRYGVSWDNASHLPSFHQGMAGIGYALLRQSCPDQLPSVLAWI